MVNSHGKSYLSALSWPTCPRHKKAQGREGAGSRPGRVPGSPHSGVVEGSRTRVSWASWPTAQETPIVDGPHSLAVSRGPCLPCPPPSCTHMAEKQALARGASWHPVRLAARHTARAASQPATRSRPARPGLYRTEQAAPCDLSVRERGWRRRRQGIPRRGRETGRG